MEALKRLGLQESEIKVYLSLLKKGLSSATQVSKDTELNRSHIYDKLDVLLEKGLVSFVIKNNVKYFKASPPEKMLDYIIEIKKDVQEIIPRLNKIKKVKSTKTSVELYQGKEGVKTVLKDVLRERKDYFVFGEEGKFQKKFPVFIQQFLRDVKKLNITEYLLSKESQKGKIAGTPKNTKIRYLPNRYFSPVMTAVYGTKTAIFIWSEPLFAILIDDKGVARSFRSYFNILWGTAKRLI